MPQLPTSAPALYESLRDHVLRASTHPEGLAALRFHGMFHGLALLLNTSVVASPARLPPGQPASHVPASHVDSDFVRLLANLVLHTHAELTHVC